MRKNVKQMLNVFKFCLCLLVVVPAFAQEGHPVKGSWIGEWEGNAEYGKSLLVILDWDGDRISGMINPGTDNLEIKSASLDPENWQVTLEVEGIVIRGNIENLELPSRSIVGTWSGDAGSGKFEIVRQ